MINFFKRRILATFSYSLQGLKAAWQSEEAIRVESLLLPFAVAAALYFARTGLEAAYLVGAALLVLIVELLNSAIEKVVDRISTEIHPLSKYAKDVGSAAVLMALLHFIAAWCLILFWRR
jgi:diacylglycerol kinase (ATP)